MIQVFLPEFHFLVVASVLLGVGMALEGPALMSLLSEEASDENRHYLFSLNSAMGTFGAAFGTLLGGFLPGVLDGENPYRDTLMVSVSFIFLQLAVISLVHPILDRKGREIKFERETVIKILKFSLPSALIGLGAGVTIPPYMACVQQEVWHQFGEHRRPLCSPAVCNGPRHFSPAHHS